MLATVHDEYAQINIRPIHKLDAEVVYTIYLFLAQMINARYTKSSTY